MTVRFTSRQFLAAILWLAACSSTEFIGGGGRPGKIDETAGTSAVNQPGGVSGSPDAGSGKTGSTSDGTDGDNSSTASVPTVEPIASFAFKLVEPNLINVPLDVAIFLDNSGSMYNEAKVVRENIERFIESVASRTDLKLVLVSLENKVSPINGVDENAGVQLAPALKARGHVQLNLEAGDRSMLATAAAAACPADTTSLRFTGPNGSLVGLFEEVDRCTTKICGQDVVLEKCNRTDYINGPVREFNDGFKSPVIWFQADPINNLAGQLHKELRADSKRVFIFISDDDSTVVDETNFLNLIRPYSGRRAPRVFAFTGIPGLTEEKPEAGCFLANFGRSYVSLSRTTGGNVFDICKLDWTDSFTSLATSLTEEASTDTLYAIDSQRSIKRILSLKYGDQVVSPSKYGLISGGYIRIDNDVVRSLAGVELVVQYEQ